MILNVKNTPINYNGLPLIVECSDMQNIDLVDINKSLDRKRLPYL